MTTMLPVAAAKPARRAAPFPRFRGWQITRSTDEETLSRIVLVPSSEQSSTIMISICLIGDRRTAWTTCSIVWPSLKQAMTIETFITQSQRHISVRQAEKRKWGLLEKRNHR